MDASAAPMEGDAVRAVRSRGPNVGQSMSFMQGWPFPLTVATLFVIVMLRANATYWLGRAARAGADRTRARALLSTKGYQRAERLVNRFGAPAVTLCFVTIGVQTMINAAAGATRMSLRRYLPAVAAGSVIWALIYATVGFVTFEAFSLLWQRSPVVCGVAVVVLLTLLVTFVVRAVRRGRLDGVADDPAGTDSTGDAGNACRDQRFIH